MNFKTVHGLGRSDYAIKAINAALDNCQSPRHVDAWLKWFDQQPADNLDGFTAEVSRQCDQCNVKSADEADMTGVCTGCFTCQYSGVVACPDDCPQPEYHLGDLEEVAHAMVKRVEDAIIELGRQFSGNPDTRLKPELRDLFDGIRAEIAIPGYVEGLLPE